jgi:hypothetical protein
VPQGEAIGAYDEVLRRFGSVGDRSIEEQLALALSNKAYALKELGRLDEAVS